MGFFGSSVFSSAANRVISGIKDLVSAPKVTLNDLNQLKRLLLSIDLGSEYTEKILHDISLGSHMSIRQQIENIVLPILDSVDHHFPMDKLKNYQPAIILFCGVNGSGKTTMIGKFCKKLQDEGLSAVIGACDTFRAAAVSQVAIWGDRVDAEVIGPEHEAKKADPASVAYKAIVYAKEHNKDVVVIDTAGRLQNKTNLMDELSKIVRVIKKLSPAAPHHLILTLDAMIGSNTIDQIETFKQIVPVSGLVINKIDGTTKAGILIPIISKFHLPIHFLGIGEQKTDIINLNTKEYLNSIFGTNDNLRQIA